jgi:hypothetical protein
MSRWWARWWRRSDQPRARHALDCAPTRLPDGDRVPVAGYPTYAEILNRTLGERTAELPVVVPLVRPYVGHAERDANRRRGWWSPPCEPAEGSAP